MTVEINQIDFYTVTFLCIGVVPHFGLYVYCTVLRERSLEKEQPIALVFKMDMNTDYLMTIALSGYTFIFLVYHK